MIKGSSTSHIAEPFVLGVDVSHHQGDVDWNAVASAGVAFAYAKATEGSDFVDDQFAVNWRGMKNAGIIRGAYHFFRPARPAKPQADNFVATVNTIEIGDLPPALDLEEARTSTGHNEWEDFPIEQRISLVMPWLEEVEQKLGRKPIVYTRRGFMRDYLGDLGQLTEYLLWIAHFIKAPEPSLPQGWTKWTFWQYSESGQVDGIIRAVDLDKFNGTLDDLQALTGTVLNAG